MREMLDYTNKLKDLIATSVAKKICYYYDDYDESSKISIKINGRYIRVMRRPIPMFITIFGKKYGYLPIPYNVVGNTLRSTPILPVPNLGYYIRRIAKDCIVICNVDTVVKKMVDGSPNGEFMKYSYYFIGKNGESYCNKLEVKTADLQRRFENKKQKRYPHVNIINKDSSFKPRLIKPLKNIILDDDTKQSIINRLDKFSESMKIYTDLGIPYKFGVLLYGPPGTGKSITATAIAHRYRANVRYVTGDTILDEIYNQNGVRYSARRYDTVSNSFRDEIEQDVNGGAIKSFVKNVYIIEEIDSLFDVSVDNKKLRRDHIIQYIDNIIPESSIVIATTNYIDKLDPTIVRDGRFDLKIELGLFDRKKALELINLYQVPESVLDNVQFPIAPVSIQNIITQYLYHKYMEME